MKPQLFCLWIIKHAPQKINRCLYSYKGELLLYSNHIEAGLEGTYRGHLV